MAVCFLSTEKIVTEYTEKSHEGKPLKPTLVITNKQVISGDSFIFSKYYLFLLCTNLSIYLDIIYLST